MRRAGLCLFAILASPAAAAAEPFSIQCFYKYDRYEDRNVTYAFTFQPETGKVVYRSLFNGSRYPGKITSRTEHAIEFTIRHFERRPSFAWNGQLGVVTWVAAPDDETSEGGTDPCERIDLLSDHTLFDTDWDWD
jgi:hypothetical protein